MKKYLRKAEVAERYGITQRTVDRWAGEVLPAPLYRNKFPMWEEDALDKSDRDAARKQRTSERQQTNDQIRDALEERRKARGKRAAS
jgi:hypothetical protein